MEIVLRLIEHLSAILEEATNFVKINMHLTFDFDEIKCLRFAVAEINSFKKNQHQAQFIGDLTKQVSTFSFIIYKNNQLIIKC
jgi:hypothetical protein